MTLNPSQPSYSETENRMDFLKCISATHASGLERRIIWPTESWKT